MYCHNQWYDSGVDRRKISYRLYPTPAQAERLRELLIAHKVLWNAALQERSEAWRKARHSISYEDQCASLTLIRAALPEDWATMNCSSQQITLRRLNKAFVAFFRRVRAGQTPGFPRFKSIHRMPGFGYKSHGDGWRFTPGKDWKHGTLRLQGIGMVKARGEARQGGTIKSCELLHKYGEWHLSLTVECVPVRKGGSAAVAADWGTEHLLTLVAANGTVETVDNPRWRQERKATDTALAQAVSRKHRGSTRWRRACARLSGHRSRSARKRLDHHHKLAARLASEVALFATEKLDIAALTASAAGTVEQPGTGVRQQSNLNREMLDTAPALLMQLITYKVQETGGWFMTAPTRQLKPSQTCPKCGARQKKDLSERVHLCPCGCTLPRDVASAQIVLNWALREIERESKTKHDGQELTDAAVPSLRNHLQA